MVHRDNDRVDDHRVQAPQHERHLEPVCDCVQDEELLEGVLEGVLGEVPLKEVLEEALECALGEGLEEALEEADMQGGKERAPG